MSEHFIAIRLDRLTYTSLTDLYNAISDILQSHDTEALHLQRHAKLFTQKAELLGKLENKKSRSYARDSYTEYYKRLDTLVSALLQHVKALRRADFKDIRHQVLSAEKLLRKILSEFVYVGQKKKDLMLSEFLFYVKSEDSGSYMQQMRDIGVERYIVEIEKIEKEIKQLNRSKELYYKGRTSADDAVKAKAELIKTIRTLLTAIDLAALTTPEIDYSPLINRLNLELKQHRTQIRNLETRRKRKRERNSEEVPPNLPDISTPPDDRQTSSLQSREA